jgi:hypothetical protein
MTKVYDNATDLITFARGNSGTALRRVGYGNELVVDGSGNWVGDFDVAADLDGWTENTGGTASLTASGGEAYLDKGSEGSCRIYQTFSTTAGAHYAVTVEKTAHVCEVKIGTGIFDGSLYAGSNDGNDVATTFTASGTTAYISVTNNQASVAQIDNISVKGVIFDRATDPLVLFNHPDDIPRIEYGSDGTLKGLLIEEQRTNLVRYSEDFAGGGWSFGSISVQADQETAPDGTPSASELTMVTDGNHIYAVVSVTAGAEYTFSWYIKSGTATEHIYAFYDQTNFQFVDRAGYTITDGEDVGNGWYRMIKTVTAPAGCTLLRGYPLRTTDNSGYVAATLGTSFLWGAQLEQGSFATSYIPTSGSTVTRSPDIASIPVSAFGYNQEAGTVVVDYSTFHTYTGSPYPRVLNLAQVGAASRTGVEILKYINNTNMTVYYLNTFQSTASTGEGGGGTAAIAFEQDNVQAAKDGSLVGGTDTSATIVPYTDMYIGSFSASGSSPLNGHIKSIQYYPRRLTNTQLQELTS